MSISRVFLKVIHSLALNIGMIYVHRKLEIF